MADRENKIELKSKRLQGLAYSPEGSNSFAIGRTDLSDFVVLDDTISRRHAEIIPLGLHWFIRDLGSTNGTKINGKTVPVGELVLLREGEDLKLGSHNFSIEESSPPLGGSTLIVFKEDSYQGEFPIGASTSFSLGGNSATIMPRDLGTSELILLILQDENGQLTLSPKHADIKPVIAGKEVNSRYLLEDKETISIGSLLIYVSIRTKLNKVQSDGSILSSNPSDESAELPDYIKNRMGDDSWGNDARRRKSSATLLTVDQVAQQSVEATSNSSPELGAHRFSSANLRTHETELRKYKISLIMGAVTVLLSVFMVVVLFVLYKDIIF